MAEFHELLRSAGADIHLIHCDLQDDGQMTVGAAVTEATAIDDQLVVQAITSSGLELYEVRLPPQLVNNGLRYKAFNLSIPYRALP